MWWGVVLYCAVSVEMRERDGTNMTYPDVARSTGEFSSVLVSHPKLDVSACAIFIWLGDGSRCFPFRK